MQIKLQRQPLPPSLSIWLRMPMSKCCFHKNRNPRKELTQKLQTAWVAWRTKIPTMRDCQSPVWKKHLIYIASTGAPMAAITGANTSDTVGLIKCAIAWTKSCHKIGIHIIHPEKPFVEAAPASPQLQISWMRVKIALKNVRERKGHVAGEAPKDCAARKDTPKMGVNRTWVELMIQSVLPPPPQI